MKAEKNNQSENKGHSPNDRFVKQGPLDFDFEFQHPEPESGICTTNGERDGKEYSVPQGVAPHNEFRL